MAAPKPITSPARLRQLIRITHKHGVALAALNRKRRRKLRLFEAHNIPSHREGIDYVSLTVRQVLSTNAKFVIRYLSHTPSKDIDTSELHALRAVGIAVGFVWETSATRALSGFAAGVEDAVQTKKRMQAFGVPNTVPCFFAVDFDAAPGTVDAYFDGVKHVLGSRAGVYGGFRVCEHLYSRGIHWCWQTYAWSSGHWFTHAQLQQYQNGTSYDHDRSTVSNCGVWEAA